MPTLFEADKAKKGHLVKSSSPDERSMKPLAAFALNPNNVHFETQEKTETVKLFVRQHPVVNVFWIIATVVLVLLPVTVFPVFIGLLPFILPAKYILVGGLLWYLVTFGYAFGNFLYWYFNIYIVTNERLVDIDFLYLLYKRFSQAELDKIQELSFASGGILATIFDFGNVSIETAGEAPNLLFEKIPHPQRVVETIRSLTEEHKK